MTTIGHWVGTVTPHDSHQPQDNRADPNPGAQPPDPHAWRSAASCAGVDPVLFHAPEGRGHKRAKAICAHCPVADPCFWSAMVAEAATGYRFGIWGGCTPAQRDHVASAMGHEPSGYQRRLQAALEAHQARPGAPCRMESTERSHAA